MGICEDSQTLGEDSWGFMRICETLGENSQDFGREFMRICGDL